MGDNIVCRPIPDVKNVDFEENILQNGSMEKGFPLRPTDGTFIGYPREIFLHRPTMH